MRNPLRPRLRKHWLSLSATVLVLYAAFLARYVALYDLSGLVTRLEVLMFLLSFPLGSLFMYIFYTGMGGVAERLLLWTLALVLGYVQWFHLVPALLVRHTPVTTLNLSPDDEVAPATPMSTNFPVTPAEKRLMGRSAPPVPQFDERGLTPLEKILRDGKVMKDEG